MSRFLVVAATAAEAAYVPGGLPIVITGVGKSHAAVETARALAGHAGLRDLTVLNIGTAGALRDDVAGLYRPDVVLNHDISAAGLRAIGLDPEERIELGGGDGTVIATGDSFVTDPAVRTRLAADASLVDMEAYAVALACARFGVALELVKHVSDNADDSAFDWPTVVDASARVLGAWLAERVSSES